MLIQPIQSSNPLAQASLARWGQQSQNPNQSYNQGYNQQGYDQGYTQSPGQAQSAQNYSTGDYLRSQLANMQMRTSPPDLQPSSRVQLADRSKTSADNFNGYYNSLSDVNATGKNQLAAEQERAAYRRLQQQQALYNQPAAPSSNGSYTPYGDMGTGVPSNPAANFGYAQNIAGNYGWSDPAQMAAWYRLGMKESGWNNYAQNPTSTAYGIGQFLDSTWGGYGIPKTSNAAQQVEAMARYIKARYGSPAAALAFHNANNWY